MPDLEKLFLHTKPCHILVELRHTNRENHTSEIATRTNCTYSHAVRIIEKMEQNNLVETHREGRKKPVKLTEKGEKISEPLNDILKLIKQHEHVNA